MCHLSVNFSDMFDPIPSHTSDNIVVKCSSVKETFLKLDLVPKDQGHNKKQKIINLRYKTIPTLNKLSRDSLSNWYANDESNRL